MWQENVYDMEGGVVSEKLFFKMDDFGIHESISYEMRDRLAAKMQAKFDRWFEESHLARKIGRFRIAGFGEANYVLHIDDKEQVIVSKLDLENALEELYEKKRARRSSDSDSG
jgi:hypothetical protein